MRYNQSLYPVPEEFKTSGQYYEAREITLAHEFSEACFESAREATKAESRLKEFRYILRNIEHFAASVVQKHYLRYKRNRKMKTGNYFKALRHNGVNYSSVLHLLLKQKWENYLQYKTDNILNYTCERVTEKINRQRAVVLIQRNFRRWSAELNYEYMSWLEYMKEKERKRNEEQEDPEMEEYRIEMEEERYARQEEDMERMREMYFD